MKCFGEISRRRIPLIPEKHIVVKIICTKEKNETTVSAKSSCN